MNLERNGYFRVFNIHAVPVFVHWSFPTAGLLISAWVGFNPKEAGYYIIAYLFLIAIHELGHAAAAGLSGLKVFAVYVSGAGGLCTFEPPRKIRQAFFIYAAGLLAQLALFGITVAYFVVIGLPETRLGQCFAGTFTFVNILMMVVNIIPAKPKNDIANDGYLLWKLLRSDSQQIIAANNSSVVFAPDTSLLSHPQFIPDGFINGIEILNDNTTPMQFVVDILTKHFNKTQDEAIAMMLTIHEKGGVLISLPRMDEAKLLAERIAADVHEQNHLLICRAVSIE